MSNMDYCRFENTLRDLRDCDRHLSWDGLLGLSPEERLAAERLILLAKRIWEEHGELVPKGEPDDGREVIP